MVKTTKYPPPLLPLLPLTWLYAAVMRVRNRLFDTGMRPVRSFPLPVIAVGNLAVGGTGKTPHTEYLIRLLRTDYHPAVLSRGYGRRTHGFRRVESTSTAAEVGDEPLQIYRKYPDITVCVDADRCEGLDRLMAQNDPAVDVAVLDDAFQHRRVRAGLYILLTDYSRRYTADCVLPVGRLREPAAGARRADIIIVTKCPPALTADRARDIRRELRPAPGQQVFFTTLAYGPRYPLFPEETVPYPDPAADSPLLAITGIARPAPLLDHLGADGRVVTSLPFPDHHRFTPNDIRRMNEAFDALPRGAQAVTTEKDAMRLLPHTRQLSPRLRAALTVQPVEVRFLSDTSRTFNEIILQYVTTHPRNRRVD